MGRKDVMRRTGRTESAVADLPAVKVRGIAVSGIAAGGVALRALGHRSTRHRRCSHWCTCDRRSGRGSSQSRQRRS